MPWTVEQRAELRDAMSRSQGEATFEQLRLAAVTAAGLMLETLTEMERLAADIEDPHFSSHVFHGRRAMVAAGQRLARMRPPDFDHSNTTAATRTNASTASSPGGRKEED